MEEAKQVLNPPKVQSVRYERNFITTAVCEVRFPTLLELESKPPRSLQAKLRKNYPFYEAQVIGLPGPETISHEQRYLFRSKDQRWTVTLKSFSIAVETSKYTEFEDFFGRLRSVLDAARDLIDSDFVTRVGLRYINAVPIEDNRLEGWIRPDLVIPVTGGVLGSPRKFQALIQGPTEWGEFSFRHGLKTPEDEASQKVWTYLLDFDYFSENVEFDQIFGLVENFNRINFAFFSWCLDEKAKKLLGEGKQK